MQLQTAKSCSFIMSIEVLLVHQGVNIMLTVLQVQLKWKSKIATFVIVLKLSGHASKDTKIHALMVATTTYKHNSQLQFQRFPTDLSKHSLWVRVFALNAETVKPYHRVVLGTLTVILKIVLSHILEGSLLPHIKKGSDRSTRAIGILQVWKIQELQSASSFKSYGSGNFLSNSALTNTSSFPQLSTVDDAESTTTKLRSITVSVGEKLIDDYQVTELPDDDSITTSSI